MTMKIDELEVGSELDVLVAEKVMDGKWIRYIDADYSDPDESDFKVHAFLVVRKDDIDSFIGPSRWKNNYVLDTGECKRDRFSWVPRYSKEIAAAWEIVEKLRDKVSMGFDDQGWWFNFTPTKAGRGYGSTAQLAICRAALKGVK